MIHRGAPQQHYLFGNSDLEPVIYRMHCQWLRLASELESWNNVRGWLHQRWFEQEEDFFFFLKKHVADNRRAATSMGRERENMTEGNTPADGWWEMNWRVEVNFQSPPALSCVIIMPASVPDFFFSFLNCKSRWGLSSMCAVFFSLPILLRIQQVSYTGFYLPI